MRNWLSLQKKYILGVEIFVKRVIVEARFYPLLRFPELVLDSFQEIIEQYTSLNKSATTIEVIHELKAVKFFSESNRAGFSVDNMDDARLFDIELNKLF